MSIKVRITGWRPGLHKINMTKAIRAACGLGLGEAKACTDAVLDGNVVEVPVPDRERAQRLVRELEEMGAMAQIDGEEES